MRHKIQVVELLGISWDVCRCCVRARGFFLVDARHVLEERHEDDRDREQREHEPCVEHGLHLLEGEKSHRDLDEQDRDRLRREGPLEPDGVHQRKENAEAERVVHDRRALERRERDRDGLGRLLLSKVLFFS